MTGFATRKVVRKVRKLTSMLHRESGIECCEEPTKYLFIGNAGLTTGLQRECLVSHFTKYGIVDDVVMIPGKSYCFIVFRDANACAVAFNNLQAKQIVPDYPEVLYLAFARSVPTVENKDWHNGPPGSVVLENFVNETEEEILLHCIDWGTSDSGQHLKHRRVIHYGYEFQYHNNNINKDEPLKDKIPEECSVLFDRLKQMGYITSCPDQLTINQYLPGQGIPPHIDTHSACEGTILSLSLGSSVIMEFKHRDGRSMSLLLPQRSMLIMSGEARYAWSHGITPRKTDIMPCPGGGLSVQNRGVRTSFTFRWTRKDKCICSYHLECDSYNEKESSEQNDADATELEKLHVHKVYEDIAEHFSETRHKPWPNVLDFVQSFPKGSVLVDVGCGNGKYLGQNKDIYEIGCDSSWNLSSLCKDRGFQVFTCNCLALPLRDDSADACISIAVIHHLANENRRLKAVQEIVRVLRQEGMALIYVWAKNQEYNNKKSSYLKQNWHNRKSKCNKTNAHEPPVVNAEEEKSQTEKYSKFSESSSFSLPLHTNRTQFLHKDVLVPWKLKPQSQKLQTSEVRTFYRYYHVFEKQELEDLCLREKNVELVKSFYDQGNWCVIIKKK
ncbi:Putative alkylated DNA repair protein alkB-like protein 8 [Gryllus bimaculatus]|nr:Putative alkylated DNA repair protein alkB-like protein 8 [Gryllus bimaculatus]